jgi:hypothetical protein
MFDTGWVAAPVEPSLPWDAYLPPPLECGGEQGWDDDPGWATLADLDWNAALEDTAEDAAEDCGPGVSWAVPGVCGPDADGGEGRLSRATLVALAEAAAAWEALRRVQARCYEALTALEDCDAVGETGYRSTARLLTEHVRTDPTEGRRLARHARALTTTVSPTGAPVPAQLPATAAKVTAGVIGPGHVEVIRTTMLRLCDVAGLGPDVLATTERQLAELATIHSPAGLAEAAAAIEALLDADGAAPDDQPLPQNELHYLRRRNGELVGKFTYRDPAAAEALHTALTVATPPADPTPEPDPDEPRGESFGTQAARTLPERRAQALLDLAGEALTRGLNTTDPTQDPAGHSTAEDTGTRALFDDDTDDDTDAADAYRAAGPDGPAGPAGPPAWTRADLEGGERVALTVTLNYDTLRAALAEHPATGPTPGLPPTLALLGENTYLRPDTARRLACDAEIIPAVLGTRGEILDIGRKTRTIPHALRRAVILRDRHCAHPGCRRRARRCQVHHIIHWADDGETCLENCVLLCSYHHTLIHHCGWEVHMIDGLPFFTPPAWLDPLRRPRHNRPWHDQQPA